MVINALGDMPKRGDNVAIGSITFEVLAADSRRLHLLKVLLADDLVDKLNSVQQKQIA